VDTVLHRVGGMLEAWAWTWVWAWASDQPLDVGIDMHSHIQLVHNRNMEELAQCPVDDYTLPDGSEY